MNLQPTLEDDKLLLRPLQADDFDNLYQAASDPQIWEQHWTTDRWLPDGFRKFFDDSLQSGGCLVIIDKSTNKIIGSSRYKVDSNTPEAVEIGWSFLVKDFWGGSYNRAFKSMMIEHAFDSKDDVLFRIAFDNVRSQKATEKLGGERLTEEAYPQYFRTPNTHYIYRINSAIYTKQQ